MQKKNDVKKLVLNTETIRTLKQGQTVAALLPTDPPGCSGTTWHCH